MFAIWLFPNEDDSKYLEKIINELSLKFESSKFIPHITIFGLINLDYLIIEKAVKKSISEIKPFFVNQTGIKKSNNVWKSIFIDIQKNTEIIYLNSKLNHIFNKSSCNEFFPHISLLYKNLEQTEKNQIVKDLKIKSEFEINKIAIIEFSEKISNWKVLQTFDL